MSQTLHHEQEALTRLHDAFERRFGDPASAVTARGPGRVNLIGDHTDYNDGFVLPMTLDRAVYFTLRRREDKKVCLVSDNFSEEVVFALDDALGQGTSWQHYVGGVVDLLVRRGLLDSGFEGVLFGNVPLGSGLSSSAALEVATVSALQALFAFDLEPVQAAILCQQVEHDYVGVQCGIMDQFASRIGREGHALFLDCRSLEYESVPVSLEGHCLVITDSKVSRSLAASKYNERRAECEEAATAVGARALRDTTAEALEEVRGILSGVVMNRARHVVDENTRVLDAASALRAGRLVELGRLMSASHASLRDLYQVSCRELDLIVEAAGSVPGVLGARMTGAGFGGCTVALVMENAVGAMTGTVEEAYRDAFGRPPEFHVIRHNLSAGPVSAPAR